MVARALHYVSIVCCAFVAVSFLLFAHAQTSHASSQQASLIAPPGQQQPAPRARPRPEGQPRRFIDEVAGKLSSPFSSVVPSDDAWVRHGIPALLALLVYGGGLGFLSRWAAGRTGRSPAPPAPPAPYR